MSVPWNEFHWNEPNFNLELFRWVFGEVNANLERIAREERHPPVVVRLQRNPDFRISTDGSSITLTTGAYQVMERLITYWQVFQEKGNLDSLGGQPLSYLAYDRWLEPESPDGKQQVSHQLVWALTLVCAHELAHVFDGHVDDRDVGGKKMIQAKEFYADMVAAALTTTLMLKQGQEGPDWNDIGITPFFGLIYLQFRPAFRVGRNWVDHLWSDNHPIGQFRFLVFRREFVPLIKNDLERWGITIHPDEIDRGANQAERFWSQIFQGLGDSAPDEWDRLTEHLNTSEDVHELVRLLKLRWRGRQQRLQDSPE